MASWLSVEVTTWIEFGAEGAAHLDRDELGPVLLFDGTWKSENAWGGVENQDVRDGALYQYAEDVKKMAADTEAAITGGKLFPFKCPIVDQNGKEVECKGSDVALSCR